MTGPEQHRTGEQEVVERPSVSTAPAEGGRTRWWSAIPSHLGRARTSTVVLGLLFVALFGLYLNVRPDPVGTTPADETSVTEPAPTSGATPPTTTSEPAPDTSEPPVTGTTTTAEPTTPTQPEETSPSLPTTEEPTSAPPLPTTSAPTG